MAPEDGLKAGMESESARLDATDRLGEEPPQRAASSSNCNVQFCDHQQCYFHEVQVHIQS